ncbi:hypothetical protein HPB50_000015 [Hyalomma asiaticum]|uniref:Uncharacterized protein n=1 Tax=Hyalomma asiaticum TaxID=266040 RepID=A0ACB7S0A8_HYAAI|nr:hypothetical protein HPB50_000015 [Hyalomma asiaticum]
MDLSKLRKPDLVMLCEEMGIEVATLRRKPLLIQALEDSGADEEELSECWELIQERMKRESEDKERETVRRKEEAEIQIREIERLRLQLQIVEAKCASSVREENAEIQADARLSMRDLLQPYKMSEDIALFLVNFERTCARVGFDRAMWPQKILTVLPCEAADTLARLPETDADDYNKIKAALLKKFRLSAEAFRRRFRDAQKTTSETFQEFAFNMKADLVEWLKGEGVYEDRDEVVDLICLEQLYGSIDEEMRLWIQDRPGERNIERAAELAGDSVLCSDGQVHVQLFAALKKEFRAMRAVYMSIRDFVGALDELEMATVRLQIHVPSNEVDTELLPLNVLRPWQPRALLTSSVTMGCTDRCVDSTFEYLLKGTS